MMHERRTWRPGLGLAMAVAATLLAACGQVPPDHIEAAMTQTSCYACHGEQYAATTAPNHVESGFPQDCAQCHSTHGWQPATGANHDFWPLTGAHAVASCADCHGGGVFQGTPTDCASCHRADYDATTDPNHVAGNYPLTCGACHTTAAWRPAALDHDAFWPLEGQHAVTDCAQCHQNDVYAGTPRDCAGCHLPDYQQTTDPNHVATQFPTTCATCHTPSAWRPADFDHDAYWPLQGKHTAASCAQCHVGGVYAGTPRDCSGCHLPDYQQATSPSHTQLGLSTTCNTCHNVNGWATSTFPGHDPLFPITTGKHRNFTCAECHTSSGNYSAFTCTGCHTGEHNLARMNAEHQGEVANYQATLNQFGVEGGCYHCHPDGRKDDD